MMTDAPPIRVMCVDDNFLIAEGISIMLRMAGGFEWLGQLPTADDLVAQVREHQPDIVLLDIDLPGRDAFDALDELDRECPHVRTIILSGLVRREFIDRAVEAGAWGYLLKGESAAEVVSAICRVMQGEFVMGPEVETLFARPRV